MALTSMHIAGSYVEFIEHIIPELRRRGMARSADELQTARADPSGPTHR